MINGITLFCDDVRDETAGTVTLVGIAPDNINVPKMPASLAKLAIYTRIAVPSDLDPVALQMVFRSPEGDETELGAFSAEFVEATCEQAREAGNPIAGFVTTGVAAPFTVRAPGRWLGILRAGSTEIITGGVNFDLQPEASASSARHPSATAGSS
jgi:hypothetical protein